MSVVDADRMLSIVILLLIQQIHLTHQTRIIQATLASTVELPCSSVNQTLEPIHNAKVDCLKILFVLSVIIFVF